MFKNSAKVNQFHSCIALNRRQILMRASVV